jgi:hypothetical protein
MKSILCFLCLVFAFVKTNAQEFRYEMLKDAPEDFNYLKADIGLWDMNLNDYNLSLWALKAKLSYYKNSKFLIEGEYVYDIRDRQPLRDDESESGYPNLQENRGNSRITPLVYPKPATYFCLTGTYYVSNWVKNTTIKYSLGSDGRRNYFVKIPTNVLHSIGIRAGVKKGKTWFRQTFESGSPIVAVTPNGSLLSSINFDVNDVDANLNYTFLQVGVTFDKLANTKIKRDDNNEELNGSRHWKTYLDVFVPLAASFEDPVYRRWGVDSNMNRILV